MLPAIGSGRGIRVADGEEPPAFIAITDSSHVVRGLGISLTRPPTGWACLAALLVSIACGSALESPSTAAEQRPNIVLIIGDDHGYTDFGFMGSPAAHTPNLDRLAAGGTLFRYGYTTASICRPALLSLLTGLHPLELQRFGVALAPFFAAVRPTNTSVGERPRRFLQRIDTLPRALGKRGYVSFQAGKYWEGSYRTAGFTEGMGSVPRGSRLVRETTKPVYAFIDANADRPFFLWFAPMIPHVPHDAPQHYRDLYEGVTLPEGREGYFANVSWFDGAVGELIDHLKRRGVWERTLLVYVADNGWQAAGYDPARGSPLFSPDGPRGKSSLYETGLRTPVIFHWPGVVPEGAVHDGLVSTVDVVATLRDYGGASSSGGFGRSLRPMIDGESDGVRSAVLGYMPHSETSPSGGYFVRTPRWYFIEFEGRDDELYDMLRDPTQKRDVALAHPDVADDLRRRVHDWRAAVTAPAVPAPGRS